ncbi:MAG: DUF711 family protein [Dehalococcoidales bacterium]|nr:DUF711 family protein [Dehalococcoidales bacterium]
MQIRTITMGTNIAWPLSAEPLERAGRFLAAARHRFEDAGIPVQGVRCATQPFPEVLGWADPGRAVALAREVEQACRGAGVDYCSLGPVPAGPKNGRAKEFLAAVPDMIVQTEAIFATAEIGSRLHGVNFASVAGAARAIRAIAAGSEMGFGNLRFAALANCPPNTPFFPAAYHSGERDGFAIAMEMADVAVEALSTPDPRLAETDLTAAIERVAGPVEAVALGLEGELGVQYFGMDLSPAPFPERERSIGEAVERLGVGTFGSAGTLFAAALITRALRKVRVRRCGFSGLMMPILEDAVLAQRASEGVFTVNEALLYSAVCGTGLDTVPLPGDVGVEQLEGILLDVASLAVALDKPLTARLMPVPGKKAGERTTFDFPYFANAAVMRVAGSGAAALMAKALGPGA